MKQPPAVKYMFLGTCLMFAVFFAIYSSGHRHSVMPTSLSIADKNVSQFSSGPTARLPMIAKMHPMYSIPLANDKTLVGASHNIFVGKVLSQSGRRKVVLNDGGSLPVTRFLVQPILNIKGVLDGPVTVEQLGGYEGEVLIVNDEGDTFGPTNKSGAGYLMQPGSTYLLSTRYESEGVYYLWDFPTASKLISKDPNLSDAELQSLAQADERVKELQVAYPDEILVADDVRNGNARNSYVSTHTPPPAPPSPPTVSSTEQIAPPFSPPPPPSTPVSTTSTATSTDR